MIGLTLGFIVLILFFISLWKMITSRRNHSRLKKLEKRVDELEGNNKH